MPKPVSPGFYRQAISYVSDPSHFAGTGALANMGSFRPGFRCYVEKLSFVVTGAAAGAGSQTYRLINVSRQTIAMLSMLMVTADVDAIGEYRSERPAPTGSTTPNENIINATLYETDSVMIDRLAGGTAFATPPTGFWVITLAQQPQARR